MIELPRFTVAKRLSHDDLGFYWSPPTKYRKAGCPIKSESLGSDFAVACARAAALNGLFDEWIAAHRGQPVSSRIAPDVGTIDWLFREYKQSNSYLEKVAPRSRKDYEWAMAEICNTLTRSGRRIGSLSIESISPLAADKLYDMFTRGPKGRRLRTAEKLIALCRKAWRVVHRSHPREFSKDVPNPWLGVTMKTRAKFVKGAVTREQVYHFAHGCVDRGQPEVAAVAVICFEWLQRPENVIAGHLKWSDYRSPNAPNTIMIRHHKTGTVAPHPLQETLPDGSVAKFYEEAEEVLSRLSRRGTPMILREVKEGVAKPYSFSGMQKIVQRMRREIGLPDTFTLDACRHGGLTELEEAELTDGQGRALSTHKTQQSYEGYAKRTAARMLSATRKRYAHKLTSIPNRKLSH
jgi:hypothetical protein